MNKQIIIIGLLVLLGLSQKIESAEQSLSRKKRWLAELTREPNQTVPVHVESTAQTPTAMNVASAQDKLTEIKKRKINVPGNDAHEDVTEGKTQKNKRGRTDQTLNEAEVYDSFAALSRNSAGYVAAAPIDFTSTTSTATTVAVSTNFLAEGFAPEPVVEKSQVPLPCPQCKCISNLDYAMATHISKCNPEEIKNYVCHWNPRFCTMRFRDLTHKTEHMNCHTGEYMCCYCKKDMQSNRKLNDHKKTCEENYRKKGKAAPSTILASTACEASAAATITTLLATAQAADKVITCGKCGQQSNLKIPMRAHKGACNPEINRSHKYVCNIGPCNMRFQDKTALNNHKSRHEKYEEQRKAAPSITTASTAHETSAIVAVTTPLVTAAQAADQEAPIAPAVLSLLSYAPTKVDPATTNVTTSSIVPITMQD